MSTRNIIALQLDEDKYKTIYCHNEGYLKHNGAILIDHFNSREKVEELLKLGDLSLLAPHLNPEPNKPHSYEYLHRQEGVCVAYGRERGEKDTQAKILSKEQMLEYPLIQYFYIFTLDGVWKYYDSLKNELRNVKDDLEQEYKELGFERPKNYYGGFPTETDRKQNSKKQTEEME